MRPPRNLLAMPIEAVANNRRRHGRLRCDDLECSLGQVLDLSQSGMRVERRGRKIGSVGEAFAIRLAYGECELVLPCKIVRLDRLGFRRHSYGLEFAPLPAETQQTLRHLAQIAGERKLFAKSSN